MLSLALLSGTLVCLFVPPLTAWAPLFLLLLLLSNTAALWTALGLSVAVFLFQLYRSYFNDP